MGVCFSPGSVPADIGPQSASGNREKAIPMPEISRFYGIVIKMYYSDHAPPHMHAEYGGQQRMEGNKGTKGGTKGTFYYSL